MTDIVVGQKLWFVPRERRIGEPYEVEVTKVGRVWLETNRRHRLSKKTLVADGGQYASPGMAYRSRDEWQAGVERYRAWDDLRDLVRRMPYPAHLSTEELKAIRDRLIAEAEAK